MFWLLCRPSYSSVLGIPWKSSKSKAATDCYFSYVLDQKMAALLQSTEHRLNEQDIEDCRQLVWMHAQRCIKYWKPPHLGGSKISTFITRLIKQGTHKFLTQFYARGEVVTFSALDTEDTPFTEKLEGTLTYEVDIFVTDDATAVIPRPPKKRARRKGNQLSMFDPEDDV